MSCTCYWLFYTKFISYDNPSKKSVAICISKFHKVVQKHNGGEYAEISDLHDKFSHK